MRLTEVEAYGGQGEDPGSHAFRGRTARNAVMFGQPGRLYTYLSYGIHVCANVVCGPDGQAAAVLLRAGEVVAGEDLARQRRGPRVPFRDLARGPGRLASALGIVLADRGRAVSSFPYRLVPAAAPLPFAVSPRTGVAGPGGSDQFSWRFWLPGEETVSPYRAAVRR